MAKGKQIYTQQGYDELVKELHFLKHEKREQIKNDIAVARSFGDLSENAEYDEARNEQAKNEARIAELEQLLENAQIQDESQIDTKVISLGSSVKVFHSLMNAELIYHLVGSNESNPAEMKISDQSPIGAALIGKRAGDPVKIELAGGTLTMKILEVTRTH
jgi:transcription elongation factor GreA